MRINSKKELLTKMRINEQTNKRRKRLISAREINRIEKEQLSEGEKLEKFIDVAYRQIYKVKEENWENEIKKVRQLAEITQKKNHKAKEMGIREAINSFFSSNIVK